MKAEFSKIDQINFLINKLNKNNSENNVFVRMQIKILEDKRNRYLHLYKQKEIEKYNLVFIGNVGSGKSTSICHLFNLLDVNNNDENIFVQPYLLTRSGNTTICEIEILESNYTGISIIPAEEEEIEKMIEDFLKGIKEEELNSDGLTVELRRAIKNLISFNNEFDQNLDLNEAIIRANLNNRSNISLNYSEGEYKEGKWLIENLKKINYGQHPNFTIPKKIIINLNKGHLNTKIFDTFQSVIDTKGLEALSSNQSGSSLNLTKDIEKYILDDSSICIFTTDFLSAPNPNILNLISYFNSQKSKNILKRFILLIHPKFNEPLNVNSDNLDEEIKSWEDGIRIKKDEVVNKFKYNKINSFDHSNILFFDALKYFEQDGNKYRMKNSKCNDLINLEKEEITSHFFEIQKNIKHSIIEEIKELDREIDFITTKISQNPKGLVPTDFRKNIDYAVSNFTTLSTTIRNTNPINFIIDYVEYFKIKYPHWNTRGAIANRFGFFDIRNIDVYFDAGITARSQVSQVRKQYFELEFKIHQWIDDLGKINDGLIVEYIPEIKKSFDICKDKFADILSKRIESFFKEQNLNTIFWDDFQKIKGIGYNENYLATLEKKLLKMNPNPNIKFHQLSNEIWKKEVEDKLISYFK
jgi:hypothetical protein